MRRMWRRLPALLVALAFAGCASAGTEVYDYDDDWGSFDDWDTNNNEVVEQTEWGMAWDDHASGLFQTWDADGSGALEPDEWDEDWSPFGTFDEDGDLRVEEEELETGLFDAWDTDDDLEIDEEEWGVGFGTF